jgi:ribosomal protein L14E/L6E/L27E
MDIKVSYIVKSLAGRDSGKLFIVIGFENENFALLSDGKLRKLEAPKKKKIKHISFFSENNTRLGEKIRNNDKITNAEIRKTLSGFDKDKDQGVQNTDSRGNTLGER